MNISTKTYVNSVCPHDCPSTCALEIELVGPGEIGRLRGSKHNTYTDGVICSKVARYRERLTHPLRLKTPLKRSGEKGNGTFIAISWNDALDEVAEAFIKAEQSFGSEAIWPYQYAGTMGLVQRFSLNRLRHVKQYSGQLETICGSIATAGYEAGTGACIGSDPREMAESDLIISWGGNPASTQVNVMSHISKARKQRNAKLVVVDPYETRTAKTADIHLPLRPGTDGALACAIMHILIRENLADLEYLEQHTDFSLELEQHLATRNVEWASKITGLSEAQITEFAKLYGETKRSFLRLGYGFTRSRNGATNMHAVSCLPAVTGAWKYRGGGALFSNFGLYKYDKTLLQGLDALDPKIRVLDMSRIGPILDGDRADLGDGPPIKAMLMQNTNPAVVAPESVKVNTGLRKNDLFLCVHEQFMTDTAKLADIVIPATTFLEHDDFYLAGGHTHVQIGSKIIQPFKESRDNHSVICDLAQRLGAEHRGFKMNACEIIEEVFQSAGWPHPDIVKKTGWHDCAASFEESHFLRGFKTEDGKFHFKAQWKTTANTDVSAPSFPDHHEVIDNSNPKHAFRLVTSPAHNYLNSSFSETKTSQKKEVSPSILMNKDDAADLQLVESDFVRVGNNLGEIIVPIRIANKGLNRGVVVIESIWPNTAFKNGIGVNALVSADPAAPAGGAIFHDNSVWIRPTESETG